MKPIATTSTPAPPTNAPRNLVAEIEADEYPTYQSEGRPENAETSFRENLTQVVQSLFGDELLKLVRAECLAIIQASGVELRAQLIESLRPVLRQEVFNGISTHLPLPQAIEVRFPRKKTRTIKPPFHSSLPLIIKLASARANGFPIPLWIHGPRGVGKSEIARQVAESFGVSFHLVALSPTTAEGKLLGFKNAATGDFVTGLLDDVYANGGVAFLDEIDIADPGVLVGLNSLISGRDYRFPNGKVVKRHPDFFVIAGANTSGSGAAEGYLRRKMDAAVLDRFVKLYVPLDPELETAICANKPWAEYMQKARAALNKLAVRNFELSPRSTLYGAAMLEAGLKPAQVMDILLEDAGEKVADVILKEVGMFQVKK
jgi:hypothetical protein